MKTTNKSFAALLCPFALAYLCSAIPAAPLYDDSPFGGGALQCINGQCDAAIVKTTYQNRAAYKLSNGAVDAIVVPEIGRIMSFGKSGGPNLMWNADPAKLNGKGWQNYGGDKSWLSPQSNWKVFHGNTGWPPEPALDGEPHKADVLTGGKLRLTSGLSKTGIRIIRTLYFDDNGEFVIEQTARKESGAPVQAGIWNITQVVPGQATFAAINPETQYTNGLFRWENSSAQPSQRVRPNLIQITPEPKGGSTKLGFDTQIAALASVRDGVAWVQKAPRPKGHYPDGAESAGFPTEIYVNGFDDNFYQELEFLSPLQFFYVGTAWTHSVRWSLHDLPSQDANAPEVIEAIEKLLIPAQED